MRRSKILLILLLIFSVSSSKLYSQNNVTADTILARKFLNKTISFYEAGKFDSSKIYCQKADEIYLRLTHNPDLPKNWALGLSFTCRNNMALISFGMEDFNRTNNISDSVISLSNESFGEKNVYKAEAYNHKGMVSGYLGGYSNALEFYFRALEITKYLSGERHPDVAAIFDNIGFTYVSTGEYNLALDYYKKSLNIKNEFFSENHQQVILSYVNIGQVLAETGEYDLAMENDLKALNIALKLYGENNPKVYQSYNNIGMVYYYKGEFDLALEYFLKTSKVMQETKVDKTSDITALYTNIGQTYNTLREYEYGLEYFRKALKIDTELFGEKHLWVATDYNNMGSVYQDMGNYDLALENHLKSLNIKKELFGENHPDLAYSYSNIALVNEMKGQFDSAFKFHNKALIIFRKHLGEKHPNVTFCYKNIGFLLFKEKKYDLALKYFQKGLVSDLRNFNDSTDINSIPDLTQYIEPVYLRDILYGKALTFFELHNYNTSLINFRIADTLITSLRKISTTKADKIALGEYASEMYEGAINTCYQLASDPSNSTKENFKNEAFYFSEKNKAGVLLEALAGQESLKFAGLPDSLLQLEHSLKVNITFFEKKLAEGPDSSSESEYHDKLFKLNREYDSLISKFERDYPEYFNLKYAGKGPEVKDIQKLLDTKTALRSYFMGDSTIYIFTLTKKKMDFLKVPKIKNLEDSIKSYQYGLTLTSNRMKENYRRLGFKLYNQLFPDSLTIKNKIENLIIIPDGMLSVIPFESLLTNEFHGNIENYSTYPFLVKNKTISYSYSAGLFYRTFSKERQTRVEFTKLNDWLAITPVFDDSAKYGLTLATREFNNQLNRLKNDTIRKRGSFNNGDYISPLPGTESETEAIYKEFDNNKLKAQVMFRKSANEQFIKSGALNDYRIVHFATHGFVSGDRPELSCILLAQDSTGGQDGILFSGEIYNLKLNVDLVVLSACETGLGTIKKGEGIIGLTRALLYAGTKNIAVSLWQVSDKSTTDLMIDFYKSFLQSNQHLPYSKCLQLAKLKMIKQGIFAHPFYWSPFILIGR
jgi:CHAT domain-containing protein